MWRGQQSDSGVQTAARRHDCGKAEGEEVLAPRGAGAATAASHAELTLPPLLRSALLPPTCCMSTLFASQPIADLIYHATNEIK